jgi:hypothetical protein
MQAKLFHDVGLTSCEVDELLQRYTELAVRFMDMQVRPFRCDTQLLEGGTWRASPSLCEAAAP